MPNAKVFLHKKQFAEWVMLVDTMEEQGLKVHREPSEADISIVLSGQYVNPFALTGKKILIAFTPEWGGLFKHIFYPVLLEYYDKVIDITGRSVQEIITIIKGEMLFDKA